MAETIRRKRDSENTATRIVGIPEPCDPGLPVPRYLSPRDSRIPGILGGRVPEPRSPRISIRQSGASLGTKEGKNYGGREAPRRTKDSHLKRYRGAEARRADPDSAG